MAAERARRSDAGAASGCESRSASSGCTGVRSGATAVTSIARAVADFVNAILPIALEVAVPDVEPDVEPDDDEGPVLGACDALFLLVWFPRRFDFFAIVVFQG